MKIKSVTIPQNANPAVSNFFDTEGLPIVALFHDVATFDGAPFLKFETPAPGQDPSNPAAIWAEVLEPSPGIATDADDAGAITAAQVRAFLGLPNLILEDGNHFRLVQSGKRVPAFYAGAAGTPGENAPEVAPVEGDLQKVYNQLARLSNIQPAASVPNILRVALKSAEVGGAAVVQTTAARTFFIGLGEATPFARNTSARFVDVVIPNGDADSGFFELAPGEKVVGIGTPAAFTTADLNFQTVKPGLDPSVPTDANWVNLVEYYTERTLLTGSTAGDVFKWFGAAQGQHLTVPELPYLELPKFLRLHGSVSQAATRTVRIFIQ